MKKAGERPEQVRPFPHFASSLLISGFNQKNGASTFRATLSDC